MCHLRLLKININLRSGKSYDFDILSFLMSLLHIILTSPAILEFNIWFRVALSSFTSTKITFYDALRDADVWTYLGSITTHPLGSRFQRVDISINYYFDDQGEESDMDKVSKAVLEGLPLLLATKAFCSSK